MHLPQIQNEIWPYSWGFLSAAVFFTTNFIFRFFNPESASHDVHQRWKWRNTANSLLHSTVTGLWSCFCLWQTPQLSQDLISVYTHSAHAALCVSFGYFIYDLIDMMLGHRKRSSFELVIHHVLVILCFGLAINTHHFLGFCIIGLLVEVNSIFLHARQLMHLQNVNRKNKFYRINSVLNIISFIAFRLLTLGALSIWIFEFKHQLTTIAFIFGGITLPTIFVMNVVLFLRVFNTDFMKKPSDTTKFTQLLLHETEDWKDIEKKHAE